MDFFLNITKDISSEIIFIYALIVFIVFLIVFILFLDKKEKKKITLTKTQELRLMDLRKAEDDYKDSFKRREIINDVSPLLSELKKIDEKETIRFRNIDNDLVDEIELEIDEDQYIEDDLEKTSAQLQLEILAKELEKAKEMQEDKIAKFEEEQEENAIISYHELLKVCDKLYDQNEKVQYMDEGNEPINLDELRARFQGSSSRVSSEIEILD